MADTQRVCICCGNRGRFTVTIMIGTLAVHRDKRKMLSSTVAMCDDCAKPDSPVYRKFCADLGLLAWMKRNDLVKLLETIPDSKTIAGGQ